MPPSKILTETENSNETINLIDGSSVTLRGGRGLRKFTFDLLLPMKEYPFAVYEDGFKSATYYIEKLEEIISENEPVWFDVYRTLPDMNTTYVTNVKVLPDSLTIEENAENGMDIKARVVLREYRMLRSGVTESDDAYSSGREDSFTAPDTYTVVSGDSLWLIAKKYLGDGSRYKELAKLNGIETPYKISVGQVIRLK